MEGDDATSPATTSATCDTSFSRANTATAQQWDKDKAPFEKQTQLCKALEYTSDLDKACHLRSRGANQTLPDAPRVFLKCSSQVLSYCLDDLDTPHMNKLGKKLWWAGPTPEVSLSQHLVLDRRIQVTEDPSVHLLWTDGILFVKPLPAYLTCHAFWEWLFDRSNQELDAEERKRLQTTSLGFLRTYARLIKRRSDFNIARRHDLLGGVGDVTFEQFVNFITSFDDISDGAISPRWRYGIVQLDALNFHSAWLLRRWHLNRFESRYGAYFSRFFPVVLFMFALFSVILSAMQVILGARQIWDTDIEGLKITLRLFVWFGTEAIAWSLAFGAIFVFWWLCISTVEGMKRRGAQKRMEKRLKDEGVDA